jgi:hypothetical protein
MIPHFFKKLKTCHVGHTLIRHNNHRLKKGQGFQGFQGIFKGVQDITVIAEQTTETLEDTGFIIHKKNARGHKRTPGESFIREQKNRIREPAKAKVYNLWRFVAQSRSEAKNILVPGSGPQEIRAPNSPPTPTTELV